MPTHRTTASVLRLREKPTNAAAIFQHHFPPGADIEDLLHGGDKTADKAGRTRFKSEVTDYLPVLSRFKR